MKHLLTAFSLLSTGVLSLSDSQCTNTHQCSSRFHSGQAFVLRGSLDSKVKLEHVRNLVQEQDPVSEWLKEFLDVVIEDVVQVDVLKGKIINTATPYLDLSNIYNPASGKLLPSTSLFSQLLVSEHSRLEKMIATVKPDWSKNKVFQEARNIVTAEYQHMIVKELMPVLVGNIKAGSLPTQFVRNSEPVLTAEEIVLGLTLSEMFEYSEGSQGGKNSQQAAVSLRSSTRPRIGCSRANIAQLEEVATLAKSLGLENFSTVQKRCPTLTFSNYGKTGSSPIQSIMREKPADGELLGQTLCCFMYQLITRLIAGDEFWYRNQFSARQILSIETSSLSSLICNNIDRHELSIQRTPLLLPTSQNFPLSCHESPELNVLSLLSDDDLELIDDDLKMIDKAMEFSRKEMDFHQKQEEILYRKNLFAPSNSSRASPSFGKPSRASLEQAKTSMLLEMTTYKLNDLNNDRSKRSPIVSNSFSPYSNHSTYEIISSTTVHNIVLKTIDKPVINHGKKSCSKPEDTYPCDYTARYRTFNGRCNNLFSPNNGMAGTVFQRLLQSEYQDGISLPRSRSVRGSSLPNPRTVSQNIHTSQATPDPQFTMAMMQWGQFIDHDLALTPIPRGFNNSIIDCKNCSSGADHPSCYPILIPKGDPTFPPHSCMAFTRSLPGQNKLGPREHMNQVTHYLDGSMVYGSNLCESEELRKEHSFLLRTSTNPLSHPGRHLKDMLPMNGNNHECRAADGQCFLAGDERVNEQPGLTAMHTMMVREHNHIAGELNRINPHWNNEKVFQESRKIISALVQHITYNEFLPRVLGPSMMKKFSLELLSAGHYDDYNAECSAAIFSEFSTAAFRFGHSMISPNLTMMTEEDLRTEGKGEQVQLRSHFNNPDLIRSGRVMDNLLRGLAMMPMETMDNRITQEVKDHLFEEKDRKPSGMDLPALNIQRGRDHGLPGYNKFREFCGLPRSHKFHFEEIPKAWVDELRGVYDDPDDVDLFPGLLAEIKLPGAIVGPTLACLIGLQFRYLRSCDRYWYESGDPMVRFTKDQLQAIRGETLSGLLCRNCDEPGRLPMTTFDKMERLTNPLTHCQDRKHLDLELWREGLNGECVHGNLILPQGTHTIIDGRNCICTKEGFSCVS